MYEPRIGCASKLGISVAQERRENISREMKRIVNVLKCRKRNKEKGWLEERFSSELLGMDSWLDC